MAAFIGMLILLLVVLDGNDDLAHCGAGSGGHLATIVGSGTFYHAESFVENRAVKLGKSPEPILQSYFSTI